MSEFNIRSCQTSDAKNLSAIGIATFVDAYADIIAGEAIVSHSFSQHSETVYEAYLSNPNAQCWLAEVEATGAPIGYAVNCPPDLPVPPKQGDVELKRIYALSRFHGTGIGAQLMLASIAMASAVNAPRLLLGTYEGNARALKFYEQFGFEKIGTRKFQVGPKIYDDIVLSKTL